MESSWHQKRGKRKTRTKAENEKGREEEASHIFEYGRHINM